MVTEGNNSIVEATVAADHIPWVTVEAAAGHNPLVAILIRNPWAVTAVHSPQVVIVATRSPLAAVVGTFCMPVIKRKHSAEPDHSPLVIAEVVVDRSHCTIVTVRIPQVIVVGQVGTSVAELEDIVAAELVGTVVKLKDIVIIGHSSLEVAVLSLLMGTFTAAEPEDIIAAVMAVPGFAQAESVRKLLAVQEEVATVPEQQKV